MTTKKSEPHDCEYCRLLQKALPNQKLEGCNALALRAVEKVTISLIKFFDNVRAELKRSYDDGLIDKTEYEKSETIILSNAVYATSRFAAVMLVSRQLPVSGQELMQETINSFNDIDGLKVIAMPAQIIPVDVGNKPSGAMN